MNARREPSQRLGRGLAALLGDIAVQTPPHNATVQKLALDLLEPNPFQPRSTFDPAALEELAHSIRVRGILQPLLVRPHPTTAGRYQIVAGERRWRAAASAEMHEVPVLVQDMSDAEATAVALVENLQRQELNPIDEAEGYDRLLSQFGLTQEALGEAVGKSRSYITNTLRLLNLPTAVKDALRKGQVSAGHARALLAHPEPEAALRDVIARQLSVRQTEALVARQSRSSTVGQWNPTHGPDAEGLERFLGEQLGLKVRVTFNGQAGLVQLHYSNLEQLDNLLSRLTPMKYN